MKQKTVKEPVAFRGIGILFGKESKMHLSPAPPNTGIIFNEKVKAIKENCFIFQHSLGLQEGKTKIYFTEHFLATCFGLEVNNLFVTVLGKELPFGDGSALPFLKLFNRAGIKWEETEGKFYNLNFPILVLNSESDGFILATPAKALSISCLIDLPREGIQFWERRVNPTNFRKELAKARTFGFYPNLPFLKKFLAFRLQNCAGLILPKFLRAKNELAGHKVLDLLGHLALLNCRINAEIYTFRPNHKLNQEFINHLGVW